MFKDCVSNKVTLASSNGCVFKIKYQLTNTDLVDIILAGHFVREPMKKSIDNILTKMYYCRNHQRPCTQILNGNYLGFDIRPFVNELSSLGGSRTGRSGPLHSFQGAFQRTSGGAARTSSLSDTSRKPTNSGFQVPNPANVLRNVTTNASGSQRGNSQLENTQTGRQGNNDRRQNQNRRGQNQNRRGQNQNRRGQSQGRRGQSQGRRTKFQGRFGQTG